MAKLSLSRQKATVALGLNARSIGIVKVYPEIFCKALALAYKRVDCFNPNAELPLHIGQPGAIFNLTFSPDGDVVIAACEKRAIVVLDHRTHKTVDNISGAHGDCVNCIRFLDTRVFASASDDCTIALWDRRTLKIPFAVLKGHADWVKNVEYNPATKQIVSSSFDNTVRVWNINEYSDAGDVLNHPIIHMDYLMRMRLSPCLRKMVITTTNCASIVLHNVDLDHLVCCPIEFDWNAVSSYLPSRHRNAIEIVQDFPEGSDSFCISSAAVHPFGWAMLSRFTNHKHTTEWTALHDIQDQHRHGDDCLPKCRLQTGQRLQYYIEEPNVGRGFIKEQCFSADGRIICSPFGNGVRFLAFDNDCSELSACNWNASPLRKFTEIKTILAHQTPVLTTQFSPTMPLLVTGCLGGKINFIQPRF